MATFERKPLTTAIETILNVLWAILPQTDWLIGLIRSANIPEWAPNVARRRISEIETILGNCFTFDLYALNALTIANSYFTSDMVKTKDDIDNDALYINASSLYSILFELCAHLKLVPYRTDCESFDQLKAQTYAHKGVNRFAPNLLLPKSNFRNSCYNHIWDYLESIKDTDVIYIPVSDSFHPHSQLVWGPKTNILMRLLHDYIHLIFGLSFDTQSEYKVGALTSLIIYSFARTNKGCHNLTNYDLERLFKVCFADNVGNTAYYNRYGKFPDKVFGYYSNKFIDGLVPKLLFTDDFTPFMADSEFWEPKPIETPKIAGRAPLGFNPNIWK